MEYKIGQQVRIVKPLGERNGNGKGNYYHGGDIQQMPLGTKAKIGRIKGINEILLECDDRKKEWYVHPDEIKLDGEAARLEQEQQAKFAACLESKLLEALPEEQTEEETQEESPQEEPQIVEKPILEEPRQGVYKDTLGWFGRAKYFFGIYDRKAKKQYETALSESKRQYDESKRLYDLLTRIEKKPRKKTDPRKFNPSFNVREEFAVWIRQQFPDLREYAESNIRYKELEQREKEVLDAAIQACNHGKKTTNTCVQGYFANHKMYLERGIVTPQKIEEIVNLIETLSPSLCPQGHLHYGTRYVEGGKPNA